MTDDELVAINQGCLAEITRLQAEVARLEALVPRVHLPLPSRGEIDRVEQVVLRALRTRGIEESRADVAAFVWVWEELQRAAFTVGRPREEPREE